MTSISSRRQSLAALDEATPLLLAVEGSLLTAPEEQPGGSTSSDQNHVVRQDQQDDDEPLPLGQMVVLCYARLIEPLAFFCIFPFIPEMIERTGVPESDIGFYSGLIESLFSVSQTFLMFAWSWAADRYGRKPTLVLSLAGITVSTILFGFSTKIWHMILLRCIAGAFGGTLVTIRVLFSENSTSKTAARAFSYFAFAGNMGIFLGPIFGGLFANPEKNMSSTFGRIPLFQTYPYALTTIVTGILCASATIASAIWVRETLGRKSSKGPIKKSMTSMELMKHKNVPVVLFAFVSVGVLGMAYTAVLPVASYTSPELGGWGFSPRTISIMFAAIGLGQSAWLLLIFPVLHHRFGTSGVLRGCSYAWPIVFLSHPLFNTFLRLGWTTVFWTAASFSLIFSTGIAMSYTGVQLALNEVSPSPETLGTLNALALTMTTAARAPTPAIFTSLFATGARTQFLGGYLVWVVLIAWAIITAIVIHYLPKSDVRGGQESQDAES